MSKEHDTSGAVTAEQGGLLVALARQTIANKLGIALDSESELDPGRLRQDPSLLREAGTFVTLKRQGQLRGCIGNLVGYGTLIDSICRNAIQAAFQDNRFSPVAPEEFFELSVEISILSRPQPLLYTGQSDLLAKLRPGVDGVIVKKGMASATFLPQVWEQLPRVEDFLTYLSRKAGLAGDVWQTEPLEIETYQVQHFSDA